MDWIVLILFAARRSYHLSPCGFGFYERNSQFGEKKITRHGSESNRIDLWTIYVLPERESTEHCYRVQSASSMDLMLKTDSRVCPVPGVCLFSVGLVRYIYIHYIMNQSKRLDINLNSLKAKPLIRQFLLKFPRTQLCVEYSK